MTDKREKAKVSPATKDKDQTLTHPGDKPVPCKNVDACPDGPSPGIIVRAHEILAALATGGVVREPDEIPSCTEWTVHDYRRFIEDGMADADKACFLSHSADCDSCQQGLGLVCEEIARQQDTAENERLFRRTMQLLDQCLIPQESPVALVVRLYQGAMELISFAGSVLQMPTLQPVRGAADPVLEASPLLLEKEFDEPPFTVQLSLLPIQGADLRLGLSVFDRIQGEFVAGLPVEVNDGSAVDEGRWHAVTDDEGLTTLTLPAPGHYRLRLIPEGSLLAPLEFALTIE